MIIAILLTVWKVVWITLLVIAAIVILLLFVPVTYRLDVDLDNRNGQLRLGWLFRFVRFRLRFEEKTSAVLGVFFVSLDFMDEKRRAKRRARRQERNKKRREKRAGSEHRVLRFIKGAARMINLLRRHRVISEAMPLLRTFLYRVRPRDVHGTVEFGLRDPARTGEIVGAVAALPILYRTDLSVIPDFETEETYIKGDIHARGHVFLLWALLFVIGLIANRNIRTFIGALRK